MKMRRILIIFLCVMLCLTGCGVKTKNQVENVNAGEQNENISDNREPISLTILSMSNFETEANVIRDQLKKVGFDVTMNIQSDYGSAKAIKDSGNYDINLGTYKVLTGNPDYGVRSLFRSDSVGGSGVKSEEVDNLIDLAASQLPDEAIATYSKLEKLLIEENVYIAPITRMMYLFGLNKGVINEDTVEIGRSKLLYWSELDLVDTTLRDTYMLKFASNRRIGSFDPVIQSGTFRFIANSNVKLLELTNDDKLTTDGALSQGYAIAEGNGDFYFILRDNINFSTAIDKKAVDTGIKVSANDVLYTIDRLKDKNSVPGHRVYDNYQIISNSKLVTDINELENVKDASTGKTIKEVLEENLDISIKELATDEKGVNNSEGKYEVIKLTTTTPFPQVLNYFTGYDAGILCEEHVKSINNFDISKYNPDTDSKYGDAKFLKEGEDYTDGHLYCSGPYTILYHNDYEVVCQRNPGFMPSTDSVAKIKNITIKIITDYDAQVSALRSGELELVEDVPANLANVVKEDEKLALKTGLINGIYLLNFNLDENKVTGNIDVRKAILNAINQDDVIAVKEGMAGKAYSTLTMLDTGNEHKTDLDKAKEYLNNYYESLGK